MRNKPSQPGRPAEGFGSSENYVCSDYRRLSSGSLRKGSRVTCFVPERASGLSGAPLVLFFHGFMIPLPEAYLSFIEHNVYQGRVVVFPSFNPMGPVLASRDSDQAVMMDRLMANTGRGLSMVDNVADKSDVTVFGHSLGALFAACYGAHGGAGRALVLANPVAGTSGIPGPVRRLVRVREIDWRRMVEKIDAPLIALAGDSDRVTGVEQAGDIFRTAQSAPSRALYCLQEDGHGRPKVKANHLSPVCFGGLVPRALRVGTDGEPAAGVEDYRYYWTALDAAAAGQATVDFDMGSWSDGIPLKPVLRLEP